MQLSPELVQIAIIAFIGLAVGGALFAVLFPYFSGDANRSKRVAAVASRSDGSKKKSLRSQLKDDPKENRRRQLQESLKELEQDQKKKQKKVTLRMRLGQAGLDISTKAFYLISLVTGIAFSVGALLGGAPLIAVGGAFLVGSLGFPRWVLNFLKKRRQETFLHEFADAIDVMVRGLKAGLPVTDAMKVIATESAPPCGPEFMEVVEGQKVGITMDQGIERMFERMPLAEVNFLSIVMSIQAKTGGNLSEALNNLSKVLRDRKKMKQKIRSISQEAKASAMIIGSLPFVITGGMAVLNPEYLVPLWETKMGHIMIAGSLLWMGTGVLVMRKMINFQI